MDIKIISDSRQWDEWLKNNSQHNSFAQAWAWGDILAAEGKRVERLAVAEGEEILAQAQIVYSPLIFGWQYAFCPQGPIFDELRSKNYELRIYETITNYLKEKNVIFLRVEPVSIIHDSKFIIQKTIDINPSATLILDLSKTEEELLAGMRQKTRYNIHLAEKKNLKIQNNPPFIPPLKGGGQGGGVNFEVFWSLMNKTGSRDKFSLHHKTHYEKVLQSPMAYQFTVYENTIPIACAVFARFGNTFTYLYGASDYARRDLMAPYLLQWEGIKMGKNSGCSFYDFFGVAPKKLTTNNEQLTTEYNYDLKHQYAGVTRFKLGFGGVPFQVPGTFDVVIDKNKYLMYNFLRKLRRLI